MNKFDFIRLSFFWLLFGLVNSVYSQCSTITPTFSNSSNKSCGLPIQYNFVNTSTGTHSTVARYIWKINGSTQRIDLGKSTFSYNFTFGSTYTITLVAIDTGSNPCMDSATTTITVSTIMPQFLGGSGAYSNNPTWQNCITAPGVPDTFTVVFKTDDTLHNYTISWGDSANTTVSGSALLSTQTYSHLYTKLGLFNIRVTSTKNGCSDTVNYTVINERNPVASLQGPPTGLNYGCVPFTTRFINTSPYSSQSTVFSWDMGDGVTYSLSAATFKDTLYHTYRRYTCNGVVVLTATNACGFSTSTWSPVQMGDKDSAILIPTNPNNCDLTVPFGFSNLSQNRYCITPNPRKYKFVWGDGTSTNWLTTNASQSKTYGQRGSYSVLLIDSNSCGKDTATYTLVIDSLPISLATASPVYGCAPLVTNFNAQYTGRVNSRSWNFGDPSSGSNNSSTDTLPAHTYNVAGDFNAVLTLSNVCGSVRDTIAIRVNRKVVAGIAPINGGCFPYVVNYTNTSSPWFTSGTTYNWTLADGSSSNLFNPASQVISTTGNYTVRLIATDSCGSDTFTRTFSVYGKPPVSASVVGGVGCQGAPLQLRYSTNNAANTIYWYHDDSKPTLTFTGDTANSHLYIFDSLRTYNNRLIVSDINGCKDTIIYPLSVNPKPLSNFSFIDSVGCSPFVVSAFNTGLSNGPGVASYQWSLDNQIVSTTDTLQSMVFGSQYQDTLKSVSFAITNSYGCSDTLTKSIKIYPKPLSQFASINDSLCGPASISFNNTSKPFDTGSISIMSFNWYFGDGATSSSVNPQHTFAPGVQNDTVYINALVAISEHGCLDTSYNTIVIFIKPVVDFSLSDTSGCRPSMPSFTNISNPKNGNNLSTMSFAWDMGNGQSSNAIHAMANYNAISNSAITYTIKLVGINQSGCIDSITHLFTLNPSPVTNFSISNASGCSPLNSLFTNTTINGATYNWFVNNVLVDTSSQLNYTFLGRNYQDSVIPVKLTSTSNFGCAGDTVQQFVTVWARPTSSFIPDEDSFCFNDPTQFLNQSLGAYSYYWNFGDGNFSNLVNPLHLFQKSKNPFKDSLYQVQLIASGFNSCKDTSFGYIDVFPYPVANFSATPQIGCSPSSITFVNNSINAVSYYWDFGDGETSSLANPTKVYNNRGFADTVFTVVLYAYSFDCVDTFSQQIVVNPKPFASFNTDRVQPCSNEIQFYNNSLNLVSLKYYFGDGDSSNQFNPLHNYNASAYNDTQYLATLIVTSNKGCKDTITRPIYLPQRLKIGFVDTNIVVCPPYLMRFQNRTIGAIGYLWDFGDQVGSASANPSHIYTQAGIYNYKLKAFDPTGCSDSIVSMGTITILSRPDARFDYSPKNLRINEQTTVNFTSQPNNNPSLVYAWNFEDTSSAAQSALVNPIYTYTDSGNYLARLVVFNGGCYDTFLQPIRVEPPYPVPDFDANPTQGCAPLISNFINKTRYAATYLWQFGDGDTSTAVNPSHLYRYPGQYSVSLIVYGPGGVVKLTKTNIITIPERPFAYFNAAPGNQFLPNAAVYAENGSSNASSYQWFVIHDATGQVEHNSNTFNLQYTFVDTGWHSIKLVAYNANGCTDTFSRNASIFIQSHGVMHIPNAFAPDDDGQNDVFKPVILNYSKDHYRFVIFNRWGQKVFETTDPTKGWDGTYNRKPCPTEVYVYEVKVNFLNGSEQTEKGVVHLLR